MLHSYFIYIASYETCPFMDQKKLSQYELITEYFLAESLRCKNAHDLKSDTWFIGRVFFLRNGNRNLFSITPPINANPTKLINE